MNAAHTPTRPYSHTPTLPRVLLLIPSVAKRAVEAEVAANAHPTMDYYALQTALGGDSPGCADLADYAVVDACRHPLVRAMRRLGRDAAMAAYGFVRRREFDVIFSNGENVSIPLAALFALFGFGRRPGHVLIGHHLSTPKKRWFLRALHRQMDAILVYAAMQRDYGVAALGMPAAKLRLIPFHADHRFYSPGAVSDATEAEPPMICSAGLEWRDYPTMIEAVRELDVEVRLAAASPWSKHRDETADRALPPNVSARRYSYNELRRLYAAARFVVVPLYDNDFQAGVTTLLEAMAMGKAVIITQTRGQRDVIEDGVNGLYVPPADAAALRSAICRLLTDPAEARRLGENARRTIEQRMSLEQWAARIAGVVREVAAERRGRGGAPASA